MADAKPAAKAEPAAPAPPPLRHVGETEDGAVQNLVAAREIHVRNGDSGAVAAVDAALAGLGFTV